MSSGRVVHRKFVPPPVSMLCPFFGVQSPWHLPHNFLRSAQMGQGILKKILHHSPETSAHGPQHFIEVGAGTAFVADACLAQFRDTKVLAIDSAEQLRRRYLHMAANADGRFRFSIENAITADYSSLFARAFDEPGSSVAQQTPLWQRNESEYLCFVDLGKVSTAFLHLLLDTVQTRTGLYTFGRVPIFAALYPITALRVTAACGSPDYSSPSIVFQNYFSTAQVTLLSAAMYIPYPPFDRAVIRLSPRVDPLVAVSATVLSAYCQCVFGAGRMLPISMVSAELGLPAPIWVQLLAHCEVDPSLAVADLPPLVHARLAVCWVAALRVYATATGVLPADALAGGPANSDPYDMLLNFIRVRVAARHKRLFHLQCLLDRTGIAQSTAANTDQLALVDVSCSVSYAGPGGGGSVNDVFAAAATSSLVTRNDSLLRDIMPACMRAAVEADATAFTVPSPMSVTHLNLTASSWREKLNALEVPQLTQLQAKRAVRGELAKVVRSLDRLKVRGKWRSRQWQRILRTLVKRGVGMLHNKQYMRERTSAVVNAALSRRDRNRGIRTVRHQQFLEVMKSVRMEASKRHAVRQSLAERQKQAAGRSNPSASQSSPVYSNLLQPGVWKSSIKKNHGFMDPEPRIVG